MWWQSCQQLDLALLWHSAHASASSSIVSMSAAYPHSAVVAALHRPLASFMHSHAAAYVCARCVLHRINIYRMWIATVLISYFIALVFTCPVNHTYLFTRACRRVSSAPNGGRRTVDNGTGALAHTLRAYN